MNLYNKITQALKKIIEKYKRKSEKERKKERHIGKALTRIQKQ
jgi:hypothetical protein